MKKILFTIFLFLALGIFYSASAQDNQGITPVAARPRGFTFQIKTFVLTDGDQKYTVNSDTLNDWQGETLWFSGSTINRQPVNIRQSLTAFYGLSPVQVSAQPQAYHYRLDKIYNYLSTAVATGTDRSMVQPGLTIESNRASNFTPPQNGRKLDVYKSAFAALSALENNRDTSVLTVDETVPSKNLGDTNTLGIRELVASGVSSFKGSPKNRRFNIAVGVEKMKGILVAPGETFSFDDNLGPVDGEHGFLPELVIKKEGTIPEFGGGLCQVSTTTFRAAMNAGFPITARRNHAYAVQYYSPQGTDATIYPGSADLKFVNDTPGSLLIWPYEKDKDTLVFDFYGTKDDRQVTLDKPVVYDKQPDGSMKATWTRHVVNNGTTTSVTFKSVYQSPALFHKTEEFVKATTTTPGLQAPSKVQ